MFPLLAVRLGTQFLADDGRWRNPAEFIDSEEIAHLHWTSMSSGATLSTILNSLPTYRIPAVPGTNGQRAVVNLTFTNNPTTNSAGTHPLES